MGETNFKIFKYTIAGAKFQSIKMPRNARILDVQMQPDPVERTAELVMWALVVPEQPMIERKLVMVDTGEGFPSDIVEQFDYIKTVQTMEPRQQADGTTVPKTIVYHLFLEREVLADSSSLN